MGPVRRPARCCNRALSRRRGTANFIIYCTSYKIIVIQPYPDIVRVPLTMNSLLHSRPSAQTRFHTDRLTRRHSTFRETEQDDPVFLTAGDVQNIPESRRSTVQMLTVWRSTFELWSTVKHTGYSFQNPNSKVGTLCQLVYMIRRLGFLFSSNNLWTQKFGPGRALPSPRPRSRPLDRSRCLLEH